MVKEIHNKINLELSFEYLLSYLFGKTNFHSYTGLKSLTEWSNRLIEIINFIEKSILYSIENIDTFHKKQITSLCERIKEDIKKPKSFNQTNHNAILGLFKLIFELIGQSPDNWELSKVNNRKHFELNEYRQLIYIQSDKQKYHYILKLSETFLKGKLPSYKELVKVFSLNCNKDFSKFIKWFKSNYSSQYLEIF